MFLVTSVSLFTTLLLCIIDYLGKSPADVSKWVQEESDAMAAAVDAMEAKRPLPLERVSATRSVVAQLQEKAAEPLPSSPVYEPTSPARSDEERMVDEDEIRCPHCGELFPETVSGMLDHLDRCSDEVQLIGVPCECQRPYWCYGCDREMGFCQVCGRFFRMYAIWAAQCVKSSPPSPTSSPVKRKAASPRRPAPQMVDWASGHRPVTRSGRAFRGKQPPAPRKRAKAVKKAIEEAAPASPVAKSASIEVAARECSCGHCTDCLLSLTEHTQ